MYLWLEKFKILEESDVHALERRAHELEIQGTPAPEAERLAYQEYTTKELMNGAIFHVKSMIDLQFTHPKASEMHKAILSLYSLFGIDLKNIAKDLDQLDLQLLPVDKDNLTHPADALVLAF